MDTSYMIMLLAAGLMLLMCGAWVWVKRTKK